MNLADSRISSAVLKRFLLVLLVAAVAALAISYSVRGSRRAASGIVPALLPRTTIAVAVLPDFERARAQWRKTEIYQLWREPAVQEFLQRPRTNVPTIIDTAQFLHDAQQLRIRDAFAALTQWDATTAKFIGGFRFNGSADDARKVISDWRNRLSGEMNSVVSATEYQGHHVEAAGNTVSVFAREWFLFANDLTTLQTLLDRLDGRGNAGDDTLANDATFVAARKPMPQNYATMVYARLDVLLNQIRGRGASGEAPPPASSARAVCVATGFDEGKIRETAFVFGEAGDGAPSLTRSALALGAKETFLFLAASADIGGSLNKLSAGHTGAAMLPIISTLTASGLTADEWNGAFGKEIQLLGDWSPDSRWPSAIVTLPVIDRQKARDILSRALMSQADDAWTEEDRDGAHYYSKESNGGIFSFSPAIALSDQILIAGGDMASVQGALKRWSAGGPGLGALQDFRKAEHTVGVAKKSFAYIDSALLYTRLDSALRPMLVMSAAFMPRIGEAVDLGKLPAPEVVTKHLSPIVMSQHAVEGGYISESVGPITASQAAIGLAALGTLAKTFYETHLSGFGVGAGRVSPPKTHPAAPVSPSPARTPVP